MFNSIMHVREICQERKIPISTLEKECGCGNGYFNPKKQKSISYEKAVAVADYLGLSVEYIMTGEKEQPSTAEGEGLSDVQQEAVDFIKTLSDEQLRRFIAMGKAAFDDRG